MCLLKKKIKLKLNDVQTRLHLIKLESNYGWS